MTERYLVSAHGPDEKQLNAALATSVRVAYRHECALTILVPALKYAEDTILDGLLGEKVVRNLARGEKYTIDGITIRMRSKKTITPQSERGVILSLWGGKEALEKCDKAHGAKAIVALPWIPEDVEIWTKKWSPELVESENA